MLTEYFYDYLTTPIGTLEVQGNDRGVHAVRFVDTEQEATSHPALADCLAQLAQYFAGDRTIFDSLTLHFAATDFQRDVWSALEQVGFGQTITYNELAERSGHTGAARAVGTAMNVNPLPIIVPCHRVLPADRSVGQYAYGNDRKSWLLAHEGVKL